MEETKPNADELVSQRRSIRSCRLSVVKPKPSIEVKEQSIEEDASIDEEEDDPPELLQPGDIVWAHVPGNPWWPALVYGSYYEDYAHTKIVKTARRPKKRLYFVYFFGPAFEYVWTHTTSTIPYSGLQEFIRYAETSVQNASSKREQDALASRFELKVPGSKRAQWDKAIEEADRAFQLPREKRVENFEQILRDILQAAEKRRMSKKRTSSIPVRQSLQRKTSSSSSSTDKTSDRSSVKRRKTQSTPVSNASKFLRVGLPQLTKDEEKQLVTNLLNHSKDDQLTLKEAQTFVCQLVTEMIKENSQHEMSCVQIEWFYDLLLNNPEIIFKYTHWFNDDTKPFFDDSITVKQCQITNLIQNNMTTSSKRNQNQWKRKQMNHDETVESSIFDILENDFQVGDLVWAKFDGCSWWPAFVHGSYQDKWRYMKIISKSGLPMKKTYSAYSFGPQVKHGWVHQAYLYRYKGLEDFLNHSESQIERTTTKRTKEQARTKFQIEMSDDLQPIWREAIKEADETLALSSRFRMRTFEQILKRLLNGTQPSASSQQSHVSSSASIDDEQQRVRSKPHESDNDVVIVKIHTPGQSSSVSLTTAICHFLDKGIPSLTIYEEIRLVNELLNHRSGPLLSLIDAQIYVEKYVMNIASVNYSHRMSFVQSDFFFDFLLKYPQLILKHRQWFDNFEQTLMPLDSDRMQLKKWQLGTLLHAHMNLE